ncbi:unnamed protein product [Agarophyton chilense]|eukprot:gb/GEZJ01004302.1/.p1 GENE.gb/GEZJ01004302.1/~~gb/GEZJ01004302.1/.p1  ORF type:complete len:756 (+),score=103.12 gb/GEZJ01004302.1/:825-3092(+)
MTDLADHIASLQSDVEKLTGSRHWLRRMTKKRRWKRKILTLTSEAVLNYRDLHSHHIKTFVLLPASAKPATTQEHIDNRRSHIFILTAVPISQVTSITADRHIFYFAIRDCKQAADWIFMANKLAAQRVASTHAPLTPFNAPFLAAWGHVPRLPLSQIPSVAKSLCLKLSVEDFQNTARRAGSPIDGHHVSFADFASVMAYSANTEVTSTIFQTISTDGNPVGPDALGSLLRCTPSRALELLKHHGVEKCSPQLLAAVLHHPMNSIVDPLLVKEKHDMTRPLNQYLISSSHNTYLESDQLRGDSTAQMYHIVLKRGCRCVEIDMWDGDDDKPVVTHGHTMTSEVSLEKVLNTIREHAFSHGTDYPLILSLENHLSHRQQIKAASLICEILGDYLYRPDFPGMHVDVLPSPEKLRGRVLLKAKTGHSIYIESKPSELSNIEDEDSDEPEESPRTVKSGGDEPSSSSSGSEKASKANQTSNIADEIAQLVYLAGGNRNILMELWNKGASGKDKFIASSCVSINEKKIAEVWENGTQSVNAIRDYNSHGLTRVYPKGSRVDSSNYTPTLAHHMGCQIVALNWQKHDNGMAVNEARFLANNGCGYVLSESVRNPLSLPPQTLHVQLLSAFMLPKPKSSNNRDMIDPYCVIKLYDENFSDENEYSSAKFDSQPIRSNGFSPIWKETALLEVKNRALAVIVLKVYDHDRTSDDDLIGYCAVPTSLLREGYRCFPLSSKEGEALTLPSTDLCPSVLCNVIWT